MKSKANTCRAETVVSCHFVLCCVRIHLFLYILNAFFFFFFVYCLVVVVVAISWAAPAAYGDSQARG